MRRVNVITGIKQRLNDILGAQKTSPCDGSLTDWSIQTAMLSNVQRIAAAIAGNSPAGRVMKGLEITKTGTVNLTISAGYGVTGDGGVISLSVPIAYTLDITSGDGSYYLYLEHSLVEADTGSSIGNETNLINTAGTTQIVFDELAAVKGSGVSASVNDLVKNTFNATTPPNHTYATASSVRVYIGYVTVTGSEIQTVASGQWSPYRGMFPNIDNDISLIKKLQILEALNVDGDINCNDITSVGDTTLVDADLSGDLSVAGDLAVAGLTTLLNLTVTGLLSIVNLAISGTLNVAGVTTMASAVISGAMSVSGLATFNNGISVPTGDVNVTNNINGKKLTVARSADTETAIEATVGLIDVKNGEVKSARPNNTDIAFNGVKGKVYLGDGNVHLASGNVQVDSGNVNLTSGDVNVSSGDINAVSGDVNVSNGDVNLTSGDINLTSGNVNISSGKISAERGLSTDTAIEAVMGSVVLTDGELQISYQGKGLILKTPDGSKFYRINIDNSGVVTSTLI